MNKSLSSLDLLKNCGNDMKIVSYPDLINYNSINQLFGNKKCIILLYLTKKNYGHWTLITKHPNYYEHFDSYGVEPDKELLFTNVHFRLNNNMFYPLLSYLYYKSKKPIHYNPIRLQAMKKGVATCGRWCLVRYYLKNKYPNVDDFAKLFKNIKNKDKKIVELTKFIK